MARRSSRVGPSLSWTVVVHRRLTKSKGASADGEIGGGVSFRNTSPAQSSYDRRYTRFRLIPMRDRCIGRSRCLLNPTLGFANLVLQSLGRGRALHLSGDTMGTSEATEQPWIIDFAQTISKSPSTTDTSPRFLTYRPRKSRKPENERSFDRTDAS